MPPSQYRVGTVARLPITIGLSLASCAALAYELLLTRVFSVTLYYHLAFAAISAAMFGSAVGATAVYASAEMRRGLDVRRQMAILSACAGLSIVVCMAVFVHMPTILTVAGDVLPVVGGFALVSIPFMFFGALMTVAFSQMTGEIALLYAADLCGAAIGSLAVILFLRVTSAPSAMILVAGISVAAGVVFAARSKDLAIPLCALTGVIVLAAVDSRVPLLRLRSAKGFEEKTPLLERWNTFSRIQVLGDPFAPRIPFGWGFSPRFVLSPTAHELSISIDAASGTNLTNYSGNVDRLAYLRYDISNAAHYFRHDARVVVVGSGGGRDVLSALAFHQKSVLGIEVNENILAVLNRDYGAFAGHLDRQPGVRFVNDEARSYLSRTRDQFDIIQISLIDTWAATAAGAFALTENSLYTVEAWKTFLGRLDDDGILTVTRWHRLPHPFETVRLCNLASAALRASGISNPRDHLVLLVTPSSDREARTAVGTLLVFKRALRENRLSDIERLARDLQWQIALSPRVSADPLLARAAEAVGSDPILDRTGIQWQAPSDDHPFFFYTSRFSSLLHPGRYPAESTHRALLLLVVFLASVVALCIVCILMPLAAVTDRRDLDDSLSIFLFFAVIGLGYMFIEIAQLQRLTILLGPPVYALSVVLFTLLVSSGIGARLSAHLESGRALVSAVLMTAAIGLIEPRAVAAVQGEQLPLRCALAIALLFPTGFVMGFAFPIGMRISARVRPRLSPWFCAINAATSVCGSVAATIVSLQFSIMTTYWLGVTAYGAAALACRSSVLIENSIRSGAGRHSILERES